MMTLEQYRETRARIDTLNAWWGNRRMVTNAEFNSAPCATCGRAAKFEYKAKRWCRLCWYKVSR